MKRPVSPTYLGRRVWAVLALSSVGLLTAGCASQGATSSFLSYQQLDELYSEEVAEFPWALPEDSEFPTTIPIPDTEDTVYESGNARASAFFYWECSWMREYFESRDSDPVAAAAALDAIKQSVDHPYKDLFYEDPDGIWTQIVDDAALGDVAEFKSFYENGCGLLQ